MRDGLSYDRPTVLVWTKRRFCCGTPGCVGTFTESAAQVGPRRRVRARLCRAIARAGLDRSTVAVARTFGVRWATACRAFAAVARQKIAALPKCPPRRLGIDETTLRRHRRFMTGLVDLDTSRVWDLIEGRSKNDLVARLEALCEQVREIHWVVIDPYAGYKAAVRDLAPHATRVADRFHIQRLAAQALTEVHCRRQQELTWHWGRRGDPLWRAGRDLLRAREHLTAVASERLDAAFRADLWDELECAWTLKEMLGVLYASADRGAARRTGISTPPPSTSPRPTGSPAPCGRGNPNCSPTSTSGSPTGPPKAPTGSSKPSNGKDSATPTSRTTATPSCTAAHDTMNPPGNRIAAGPQNAESRDSLILGSSS